jgi:hypothetical protein
LAANVGAQVRLDPAAAHSHSGQFVIRFDAARGSSLNVTNRAYFRVDPALLTISCERIKANLLRELGGTDAWQGKIFISLYPARVLDDSMVLTTHRFSDGWHYNLDLPDVVEHGKYVRAITQALLIEIANRGAKERSAEVPLWLIEGLGEELLASKELEIVLQAPKGTVNGLPVSWMQVERVQDSPIQRARQGLGDKPPLSFEELSWPNTTRISGSAEIFYRASAQILVHQLLASDKGRERMRDFLARLPQHFNWQFAFLKAFHFDRPLDVEKWWALQVSLFMGRDPVFLWTWQDSREKLASALRCPVQVRPNTNALPASSSMSLQAIIREWNPGMQFQTLQAKSVELEGLRPRLTLEFVPLVDEYRRVLDTYVKERMRLNFAKPNKLTPKVRQITEIAIRDLDGLDARLQTIQPLETPKPAATMNAGPVLPSGQ